MKKLIALFIVATAAVALSFNADARRFGVKAGVNVMDLNVESVEAAGVLGYQAGLSWQFDLPLGFAIQPDIMYHVKATKVEEIESSLGFGYVEVPVNIQWGLRFANKNIRLFAQASPFVGYAVSQIGKTEDYVAGENGNKWDNVNRLSYGAGLGAGLQLGPLQLTASYNWDFGNSLKGEKFNTLFNKSNFSGYTVSLALMFGNKKK